jgi:hypothetical protein
MAIELVRIFRYAYPGKIALVYCTTKGTAYDLLSMSAHAKRRGAAKVNAACRRWFPTFIQIAGANEHARMRIAPP